MTNNKTSVWTYVKILTLISIIFAIIFPNLTSSIAEIIGYLLGLAFIAILIYYFLIK